MKTENVANRNYNKSTVYETLYVFIVRVQVPYFFMKSWSLLPVGASRSSLQMSRQASFDSKSRTVSVSSMGPTAEIGQSAPMMKVIGQLWCHEVTRTFADRLISDDGKFQYELATAEIDVYLDYLKGRSFLR